MPRLDGFSLTVTPRRTVPRLTGKQPSAYPSARDGLHPWKTGFTRSGYLGKQLVGAR